MGESKSESCKSGESCDSLEPKRFGKVQIAFLQRIFWLILMVIVKGHLIFFFPN